MQHTASQGKETGLGMGDMQTRANPCNPRFITRNEGRSAVLKSARRLSFLQAKSAKTKSPDVGVGALSAVRQQVTLSQRLVHTVGSMSSHGRYPVRVAVKGHGYAGVP